ncbi:MAG: energy transducer TonB [Candidatus Kapabacteria bacterium]|nr:energy transducer TonB [Candidatus Kapabacteria bacterium]
MSTAITLTSEYVFAKNRAKELKEWIGKFTYRAFAIATGVLILFFLFFWVYNYFVERSLALKKNIPVVKLKLTDLPPPPSNAPDVAPPPPPSNVQAASGPAAVAGNPVPVPETMLAPDAKDFANVNEIARATSTGGDGTDNGGFAPGDGVGVIDNSAQVTKEEEPDPGEFVAVEKEPAVDIADVQRRVVYPEMAKRAGIEGTVSVRVLVGKNGKPIKYIIDQAVSDALDQAAAKAVMECVFTPAIQNGSPIDCWVNVPVKFKLR